MVVVTQPRDKMKQADPEKSADCIPNIGPRERRRRFRFGIVALVVGLVVATALVVLGAHPLLRLPLFVLFSVGATGIFQAREKT